MNKRQILKSSYFFSAFLAFLTSFLITFGVLERNWMSIVVGIIAGILWVVIILPVFFRRK